MNISTHQNIQEVKSMENIDFGMVIENNLKSHNNKGFHQLLTSITDKISDILNLVQNKENDILTEIGNLPFSINENSQQVYQEFLLPYLYSNENDIDYQGLYSQQHGLISSYDLMQIYSGSKKSTINEIQPELIGFIDERLAYNLFKSFITQLNTLEGNSKKLLIKNFITLFFQTKNLEGENNVNIFNLINNSQQKLEIIVNISRNINIYPQTRIFKNQLNQELESTIIELINFHEHGHHSPFHSLNPKNYQSFFDIIYLLKHLSPNINNYYDTYIQEFIENFEGLYSNDNQFCKYLLDSLIYNHNQTSLIQKNLHSLSSDNFIKGEHIISFRCSKDYISYLGNTQGSVNLRKSNNKNDEYTQNIAFNAETLIALLSPYLETNKNIDNQLLSEFLSYGLLSLLYDLLYENLGVKHDISKNIDSELDFYQNHKITHKNNVIIYDTLTEITGEEIGTEIYWIFQDYVNKKHTLISNYLIDVSKNLSDNTKEDKDNLFGEIYDLKNKAGKDKLSKIPCLIGKFKEYNDSDIDYQKGIDYLKLFNTDNFNIYGNNSPNFLANIMQQLHDPQMIKSINKDIGFDITLLSLQNQTYLAKFLYEKSTLEFKKFKNIFSQQKNKLSFLNTFLACSKTPEIGDKILELAKHNGSEKIFEAYAELINLQSDIDSEDIDSLAFLRSIISRGEKLLLEALKKAENGKNLSIDKKYSSELVRSGAFVKALISKNKSGKVLEKKEFNEKCPYYNIDTFSGGDDIIKSDDQLDLLSEENYISSEIFGKEDYKMIVDNLKEAYQKIDPKWLDILISNITEDLQNPDVTFYMMRDKNTGKLVSLCKSNKGIHEGELYLGTHYVEQDLRGDFGFGDYVLKLAIQENQDIDILTGSVVVNNPNLERHINFGGFSATDIVFDSDKNGNSSGELFKVDINKNYKYESKNKSNYSDEHIKQLAGKPEKNNIIAYQLDSLYGSDQEFKNICNDNFNNGYILTRLFYEKNGGQPDLSQTYIVFEKNEEL